MASIFFLKSFYFAQQSKIEDFANTLKEDLLLILIKFLLIKRT